MTYTASQRAKALAALEPLPADWGPPSGCGLDEYGSRLHVGKSYWRDPERDARWQYHLHQQRALYAAEHPAQIAPSRILKLPKRA